MVRREVGVKEFAGVLWWSEDIARLGYVFLAHQDFVSSAGARKGFPHSSRRVSLNHCLNGGSIKLALGQVRLRAATVLLDDNKLRVIHGNIVRPDERERVLAAQKQRQAALRSSGQAG